MIDIWRYGMSVNDSIDRLSDGLAGEDVAKGATVSRSIDILREQVLAFKNRVDEAISGEGGETKPVVFTFRMNVDPYDQEAEPTCTVLCDAENWADAETKIKGGAGVKAKFELTVDDEYVSDMRPEINEYFLEWNGTNINFIRFSGDLSRVLSVSSVCLSDVYVALTNSSVKAYWTVYPLTISGGTSWTGGTVKSLMSDVIVTFTAGD